ncbi:uncharacterized protein LOC144389788 [Gasterosteus aculeatus]
MSNVQKKQIMVEKRDLNSKEVDPPVNFYLRSLEEQVRAELDSNAMLTQTQCEGRVLLQIDEDRLQQFLDLLPEKKTGEVQKEICQKTQLKASRPKLQKTQGDVEGQTPKTKIQCVDLKMKGEKQLLPNFEETISKENLELKGQLEWMLKVSAEMKLAKTNTEIELESQLEIERAQTEKLRIELAEALKNKEEAVKQVKELFQAFQEDTMSKQRAERDKMAAALKASQDLLKSEHFTTQQMTTNQGEMQQFKASSQAKLDEQRDAIIKLKAALEKSEQDLKAGHLQWQQEKVSLKEHCVHLSHSEGQHMGTQTHAVDQEMDEQREETIRILATLKATQDELQAERMKGEKQALQNDMEAMMLKVRAELKLAKTNVEFELESQLENERAQTKEQQIEISKLAEALKNKEEAVKQVKELFQAFQEDTMSKQRAERDKMAAALKASQDLLKSEHFTTQQMTTNQGEMQQFKASSQAKLDEQRDAIIKLKAALEKSEQDLKAGHLQWQQEKVSLKEHCVHLSHSEGQHMGTQTHAVDQEMDEQREETIRILATLKATQDELQAERMKGEKQALQNDMEAMMLKVRAELKLAKTNVEFELESQLENERAQTKEQQIEISKLAEALKNKEEAVKQVKELFQAFQEDTMSKQRAERDKMAAALKASQDLLKSEHFTTQQMTTNQGEMQQFKASSQAKLDEQRDAIIKLKAALEKSEQDLKAGHLQWQQEKVSLKEHCVHLSHSEGQHMGTQTHAVDQEMDEQREETIRILATLKATQDELQAERMKGEKQALQNDMEAMMLKVRAELKLAKTNVEFELESQLENERAQTKEQQIEISKLAEALKNKEEAVKQVKELFQAFQEDTMSKQRAERDKMAAALKASQDLLKSEHFTTQQMTTNQGEMQQFKASSQAKLDEQRDAIIKLKAALEKSEQDLKAGHLQWQQEKVSLKEHCVHLSHSEGQHMGTQTHAVDQEMDEQREETIRILATLKATQDELQAERMKGEKQALQNDMEAMMLKVRAELKLAKTNVEFELESQLENERAQTKEQQIEISKLAEALKNKEEAVKQVKELFQAFQEDTMSKQRAERDKMAAALKASQDLLKSEHFTTQQMTTNQGEMQQFKASSQAKLDEQRDAIIKLKAALEKSEQDLKAGHLQWQQEKVSLKEHCVHLSHSEGQHMGTQTHAVDQEMDEQREETIRILATLKATQDELQAERMKGEKQALQNDMEAMMLKVRAELKLAKTNVEFELESQLENERAQTKEQQIEISKLAEALKNKEEAVKQVKELFQAFQEDTMSKQRAERDKMAAALKASQDLLKSEHFTTQQMTTNQGEMQQFKASSQAKLDEQRDAIIKLKAALEKSEQDLKAGHLQWQQEKVSLKEHCVHLSHSEGQHMGTQTHAVDQEMDEQREETIRILATLKATQDELQAERMKGEKQALQNDMEAMMLKVRAELKLAKTNVEFELESQLEIERAQTKKQQIEISTLAEALKNQQEAVKQVKELFQAFQEDTMSKQRAERDKMAAALKASQDLLKSEEMTTNQGEMQQFKASSQAKLDEQTQINESTKAALLKSEHCLHNARLEWQKERSSLTEVRDVLQAQVKTETEAKQTLERIISAHQGQLEEQKAKSNETLLAMKVINVRLETQRQENSFLTAQLQTQDTVSKSRTIEWEQERSHLTARLNKTSTDLEHALLRNVTLFQTMEKEAAETFERNQASQEQLISTIRKDKDDSLERQRLSFQDMISHLETSNRNCVTKQETQEEDHKNLLASLIKKFEDDRESKRHEWNQERSDLLKIAKQSLAREEEYQENNISLSSHVEALQCQINKPKKKWYKLF